MAHLTTPTPGDATAPNRPTASLTHRYDDPREAVMLPHKFMALTHYYVDRWLPELGERGHIIVTVLRRLGYLDRARNIERGGIEIEQEALAALCGLKLRTFQREFASDAQGQPVNPALHQFIQREKQYSRNTAGLILREKTVYVVQMRDPLHPSDQAALDEECRRRDKNQAKPEDSKPQDSKPQDSKPQDSKPQDSSPAELPKNASEKSRSRQSGGNEASRSRQLGGEARQSDTRSRQSGGAARQVGGNINKESDYSLTLLKTILNTAARPGGSTSSFPEKAPGEAQAPETAPAPLPLSLPSWDSLGEAQQRPYLKQAEQELTDFYRQNNIEAANGKPSRRMVLSRAQGLYQKQKL